MQAALHEQSGRHEDFFESPMERASSLASAVSQLPTWALKQTSLKQTLGQVTPSFLYAKAIRIDELKGITKHCELHRQETIRCPLDKLNLGIADIIVMPHHVNAVEGACS